MEFHEGSWMRSPGSACINKRSLYQRNPMGLSGRCHEHDTKTKHVHHPPQYVVKVRESARRGKRARAGGGRAEAQWRVRVALLEWQMQRAVGSVQTTSAACRKPANTYQCNTGEPWGATAWIPCQAMEAARGRPPHSKLGARPAGWSGQQRCDS